MSVPMLIDDRAGSRELMKYPAVSDNADMCRLDSGDVAIFGNGPDGAVSVGVEVKSIWDLISSASTGRLQATQIPAMLAEYDINWLLYFGIYRPSPRGGELQLRRGSSWRAFSLGRRKVPYGYLEALLLDLAALGVGIKHTSTEREAAEWLSVLHRWWSKSWDKHKGMRTLDKSHDIGLMPSMDEDMRLRVKVAAQLPGVGFERAMAAARYFPSVLDMINAHPDDWARIDGIGKVVAKAVTSAVRQ